MADNERNAPIQDPENLENKINEPTVPEAEVEVPVVEEEAPVAEEGPVVEEEIPVAEEVPAVEEEIPVAEEGPVVEEEIPVAEEVPAAEEEVPVAEEPVAEQTASETPEPYVYDFDVEVPEQSEPYVYDYDVTVEGVSEAGPDAEEQTAPVEAEANADAASESTDAESTESTEGIEGVEAYVYDFDVEVEGEQPDAAEPEATAESLDPDAEAEETVDDDDFGLLEIGIDEDGNVFLRKAGEGVNTSQPETQPETADAGEGEAVEEEEEIEIDPEELIIYDDVVDAIRSEGSRLENNEFSLYAYNKHCKEAIRTFESALKTANRALDANRDEREAPILLAGIIKICGKILEIRCDNLENYVRIKAYDYIRDAKPALHEEIDRYNELIIEYSSLTGEQLTRLSTLLPENISSGNSLAVVPELAFAERYVQLLPDEKLSREDEAALKPIVPTFEAEDVLANLKAPKSKGGCSSYARKIRRAEKRLNKECIRLNKLIASLSATRKKYDNEMANLEARTPLGDRTSEEYKSKVLAIGLKYGKQLAGIKTDKARNAFARTRLSMTVNRMALERERLVLAYEYMRAISRAGKYSQKKKAEDFLTNAILAYNKCAEVTSRATGATFDQIPIALIEHARNDVEIEFPKVAYKRELVELVGSNVRRISMAVVDELAPDEQGYAENSEKVLSKHATVKNTNNISEESALVDRASAIAKIMIEMLRDYADQVLNADDLKYFDKRSRRAIKYFKRARRATEKAISKAFDEHGVVTALIENLRVIANFIEVRRICIAANTKLKHTDAARRHGRALYKLIELYNGRAIDYTSIVGEQFSRITLATSKELVDSAGKLKVPVITYKDNYIEVFPKDPLKDSTYEKPRLWRSGVYTPLMMHHYRLTENRSVETTVVNSPFVFDVMADDHPAISWWHPIGFWQHLFVWAQPIVAWWNRMYINAEIWFIDESLLFSKSGLDGRQSRNDKKKLKYERKFKRLNDEREAKILALETVVHETDRHKPAYQKKLYNINSKFSRKLYRLKLRFMRDCTGRNASRLMLERLVLERERITGMNKVLLKYRNYGRITFTPNVLVRYKKKFVEAINDHNKTASRLSEMVGVQFSQVSTSVADEIIRYGKMLKFPEIVCCREVIETVDGVDRTVGDKWHGYGLYTGTSGSAKANGQAPIMSVGAMGYATDMGVPFLKADFDGMTMLGMTPGGVPLIGFSQTGETSIPFTGTPMMLSGTDGSVVLDAGKAGQDSLILGAAKVSDPYSGINRRAVDSAYTDDAEEDAKDLHSGCTVETPLDLEAKMVEERFRRALRARSMTTVDGVGNWWRQVGSEINLRLMRWLTLRPKGFLRFLLPPKDGFVEIVNTRLTATDAQALQHIARVGGIIEIECKRLYSATKTGIRRSQRVFSAWLHEDIQLYNNLVKEFNSTHERYMHIESLSLNIPDTIVFRKTERPPTPPILSMRNRVKLDETQPSIKTDEIYDKLVEYAISGASRYAGLISRLWSKLVTVPRIKRNYKRGNRGKVLALVTKVIIKRSSRTYLRRQDNENRHYRIRYEKARSMRRYNRRTLRAIGVAGDPIKYQSRVHKVLRSYLARNFRIDYNMRIRQLIYRALRIDATLYWVVTIAFAIATLIAGFTMPNAPALQTFVNIALMWVSLPIVFFLLRIVYEIVMFIVSCLLLVTRNIWLIKYGARDVERNRYGAILDCFVTEQYRLLLACERLRHKPNSGSAKKMLIASVNDYNKRIEVYSEVLRVPIKSVETTTLIDKLMSGDSHILNELQNFVYVRELVERVDTHQVGKTLSDRELGDLVGEINGIINSINLAGSSDEVATAFLQGAMERFVSFVQTGIKPTQNEKFELKRDLIQAIAQFNIGAGNKEIFAKDVIAVVDQLGGRDRRRIIGTLAEDDMII